MHIPAEPPEQSPALSSTRGAHRRQRGAVGDVGGGEARVVGALHQLGQQQRNRAQQLIRRPRDLDHPVGEPQRLLLLRSNANLIGRLLISKDCQVQRAAECGALPCTSETKQTMTL